ncbi:heme utilization cystosolic carrier protein HutX [Shewanella sp. JM162201]|uniref:Heme utilization cystosolic carrier protein HutX n=1 Tax=Shewanella jiangmenensis TaxID=2837387 RepID=A0ABS5UZV2_9GAMM|nr:heme utilization cystosolic carrier protein HutX [Shewanella jiangmenensis]MBT1443710.1 heme utilization cystosolic carrier protein HutX [Shewanella jiangmenensis]
MDTQIQPQADVIATAQTGPQPCRQASIEALFAQTPELSFAEAARTLGVSELAVLRAMPPAMVAWYPLGRPDAVTGLLTELAGWGPLTAIIQVAGNVFEFKGPFPLGKPAHGYYNLIQKGEGIDGHIKPDSFAALALVSRPMRGRDSHHFCFFAADGSVVFKLFLGRDKAGALLTGQLESFMQLRATLAAKEE